MIDKPTVLILGAGASHFLEYPLGAQLKRTIVSLLRNHAGDDFKMLRRLGFAEATIMTFASDLAQSGRQSVDAFLEHRADLVRVGKAAMAQALMRHENITSLFENQDNWYEYLFAKMNTPFEAFSENRVAVVTFNYDRSLEFYIFTALKKSYGKSDEEVARVLDAIPIVHVHGQLGPLPWTPSGGRPYRPKNSSEDVAQAAEGIRIVHEDTPQDPHFSRARELIHESRRAIFLGFGYDPINLSRLSLQLHRSFPDYFGTSFGLTQLEATQVQRLFSPKGISQGALSLKVLEYLRCEIDW